MCASVSMYQMPRVFYPHFTSWIDYLIALLRIFIMQNDIMFLTIGYAVYGTNNYSISYDLGTSLWLTTELENQISVQNISMQNLILRFFFSSIVAKLLLLSNSAILQRLSCYCFRSGMYSFTWWCDTQTSTRLKLSTFCKILSSIALCPRTPVLSTKWQCPPISMTAYPPIVSLPSLPASLSPLQAFLLFTSFPGRPIVSVCNCPTKLISKYLECSCSVNAFSLLRHP